MPVSNGEAIRVDVVGDYLGTDTVINTYQFGKQSGSATSDQSVLDDMIELLEALYTILKGLSNAQTIWRRIRVQNLDTGWLVGEASFDPVIQGTSTGNMGAPGVAALMTFPTNTPRVVMRKYVGPLAPNQMTSTGQLATTAVDICEDAVEFLLDLPPATNSNWIYGYLSPKTAGFETPTTGIVSVIPAYQRRRRQGRGD